MIKATSTFTTALSALVIACAMAAFFASPAAAGAAKNLKCDGCVNSKDIKNSGIKSKDMKAPPGGDFIEGTEAKVVAVNTLVRSINVTAPDAGTVIVNSGGNAFFGDPGSDVSCSITTGTTVASVNILVTGGVNEGSSIATTRGFSVPKGSTTFKLVCTLLDGAATVNDAVLTAIFVPERF